MGCALEFACLLKFMNAPVVRKRISIPQEWVVNYFIFPVILLIDIYGDVARGRYVSLVCEKLQFRRIKIVA